MSDETTSVEWSDSTTGGDTIDDDEIPENPEDSDEGDADDE